MKEYKVGEIFKYDGVELETLEGVDCNNCHFNANLTDCMEMACSREDRTDSIRVIFKECELTEININANGKYNVDEYEIETRSCISAEDEKTKVYVVEIYDRALLCSFCISKFHLSIEQANNMLSQFGIKLNIKKEYKLTNKIIDQNIIQKIKDAGLELILEEV